MDSRQLYAKGIEAYDQQNYDEARQCFERLIAGGHKFADVLNKLAFILSMNKQLELAAVYLKEALAINPRYTEAAVNLMYILSELGRYDEAKKVQENIKNQTVDFEKRKIDPFILGKIANMHAELGERYLEIGFPEEALLEYRKAVKMRPAFVDLRTRLAVLLRENGKTEEAIEQLTGALLENPNYLQAHVQLGLTYFTMGEPDIARKHWDFVLKKNPNNTMVKAYLSMLDKGKK